MGKYIKIDLKQTNNLLKNVRKQYKKLLVKPLHEKILELISRGISPVQGERFQKYSKSYKEQIRGKALYYTTKNKKVARVPAKRGQKFSTIPYEQGKKISPVNMELSGDMLRKLKVSNKRSDPLVFLIAIKHKLADIHNRRGAGKSKVVRRLLPREGERFKKQIRDVIKEKLKEAVINVVKKFNA